jgi:molybdate transport system regulatory protein
MLYNNKKCRLRNIVFNRQKIENRYSCIRITTEAITMEEIIEKEKSMKEPLKVKLSIKLYQEKKAFGPGLATLLRFVEQTGSLQKASSKMNMAYSKAWKMIRETEKQWGFSVTYKETGGRNGGGSRLTENGRVLLEHYEAFYKESEREVGRLFEEYFSEEFLKTLPNKEGKI